MITMSVDIGGEDGTGVVIYDGEVKKIMVSHTFNTRAKGEGVLDFAVETAGWAFRYAPDLIITAIPTAHRSTIARHFEKIGALRIIAHQHGAQFQTVIDSNCKLLVLGDGGALKLAIQKHYEKFKKLKTEHERDAFMFIEAVQTGKAKSKN